MIKNRYFLLSEFFRRDALNLDEGAEIYFYTILFSNVVIRIKLKGKPHKYYRKKALATCKTSIF